MKDWFPAWLTEILTFEWAQTALRILITLLIGLIVIRISVLLIGRLVKKRASQQTVMLLRKAVSYGGTSVILLIVLSQLGVKLTALLGAAGIIGIAVGFASQTSMSNLISGLFLVSEKPFAVGDLIRIEATTGIVMSIDLLSVKVRKFDNQFIRIPNEKILNSELTNITRFPIRRMDIKLGVAYKEDIGKVRRVLEEIADENPYCLDEPEPLIIFTDFGESALEFLFAVWFEKSDYLNLKNSIMQEIKERFQAVGIEIPFPHRTVYTGSATKPFPVRVADEAEDSDGKKIRRKKNLRRGSQRKVIHTIHRKMTQSGPGSGPGS